MAWTYEDWRSQSGDAAKLARLELFITEVSARMATHETSDSTYSRGPGDVLPSIKWLEEQAQRLERRIALVNGSRISHVRKGRPQ